MPSIPEHIVERVKSEANIVDVISDYVQLRRTGKNWIGRCPFHDDTKPSMAVEPVRGIFKCFACGKGGNVFTFLMDLNGWTFPETVRSLATSLHIEIPEDTRERKEYSENERLITALQAAAKFFYDTLHADVGTAALAYFKRRGFTSDTIGTFQLGYSPDDWEALMKHLSASDFSIEELERAGLIIRREGRSSYYDRFRGRAMFPIFSATGRVLGFGARRMNEDPEQPKYINSPESPVYRKSRVLYGLFQAKDAIRKSSRAVIVEGYADVISLHQAGIQTAIATCGTALTDEHAELIKRYTQRVVLVFDSDKAGQAATDRGIEVLLRAGLDVSVLRLPDGEDPDTFVQKYGAKEFDLRTNDATSFLEFRVRTMRDAGELNSPESTAAAIRSIASTIALIPDELKRELVTQQLTSRFSLPERLIQRELEQALGAQHRGKQRYFPSQQQPDAPPPPTDEYPTTDPTESEPEATPVLRKPITRGELPPEELGILSAMVLGDPQLLEHVFARIDPDDFAHPVARDLIQLIFRHYADQRPFTLSDIVMENLEPELRDLLTLLAVEIESTSDYWISVDPETEPPNPWRIARDCLIRMEYEKIGRAYRAEQEKLREADMTEEQELEVFTRLKELGAKKHELDQLINA